MKKLIFLLFLLPLVGKSQQVIVDSFQRDGRWWYNSDPRHWNTRFFNPGREVSLADTAIVARYDLNGTEDIYGINISTNVWNTKIIKVGSTHIWFALNGQSHYVIVDPSFIEKMIPGKKIQLDKNFIYFNQDINNKVPIKAGCPDWHTFMQMLPKNKAPELEIQVVPHN